MHDRRIDGRTHTFGNQGALFMRAMTWWDHETQSIWSQPWGAALAGPLEGARLDMIPANIVPWSAWLKEHPDTQLLVIDGGGFFGERFSPNYVIGITLGDHAKPYDFEPARGHQRLAGTLPGTGAGRSRHQGCTYLPAQRKR